ncbi:hypothetical protein GQ53DRAFT_511143 [Thozetella sp. PMI_491]|nr:hypothetical protein GQ53DRAFT_511143 [Thozetella sp. PMI_491]
MFHLISWTKPKYNLSLKGCCVAWSWPGNRNFLHRSALGRSSQGGATEVTEVETVIIAHAAPSSSSSIWPSNAVAVMFVMFANPLKTSDSHDIAMMILAQPAQSSDVTHTREPLSSPVPPCVITHLSSPGSRLRPTAIILMPEATAAPLVGHHQNDRRSADSAESQA